MQPPLPSSDSKYLRLSGFTLLELAIVFVVIGLIIGGVLAGQHLINSAEISSVLSELDQYETAIAKFKDKYGELPGDMPNATDIWGAANADNVICRTTQGTGTQTCNGDGNGMIEERHESWRSWQQLQIAGFIDGNFTGIADTGGNRDATPGKNIPTSSLKGGGYTTMYISDTSRSTSNWYTSSGVDMGNSIMVGRDNYNIDGSGVNAAAYWPLFTTKDAYNIDLKMDDGKPAFGRIRSNPSTVLSQSNFTPNCATSDVANSATYKVAQLGKRCSFTYKLRLEN